MKPFVVLSGSMEPSYQVGSVVYSKKINPELVEVGDPITYVLNEDLVVVTHRVVDIDKEEKFFVTKGDANETVDAQKVHFKNLIGVVKFSIPYIGYLFVRLQNKYFLIALIAVYFILILLEKMLEENENE